MVQSGFFWATVASVYESSVIAGNSSLQAGQQHYEALSQGNIYIKYAANYIKCTLDECG